MSDDVMIIEKSELVFDDRWSDTDKRFVTHYLGDALLNATQAAKNTGIPHANAIAYRYLKKEHIREAIAQFLDDLAMERDEVLGRLSEMARASISDFLITNDKGEIELDFNKIVEKGYLVKSAYRTREGFRLELHDSQKALELIGKHLSLFSDKFDVNVNASSTDDSTYMRNLQKIFNHHYANRKVVDGEVVLDDSDASPEDKADYEQAKEFVRQEKAKQIGVDDVSDELEYAKMVTGIGQKVSANHYIREKRR